MEPIRCPKCNKLLGKLTPPYEVKCPRCHELVIAEPPEGHHS
jgi:phage FluMu protein Com